MVEVGVHRGDMSAAVLYSHWDVRLLLVDIWGPNLSAPYRETRDRCAAMGYDKHIPAMFRCVNRLIPFDDRVLMFRGPSSAAASLLRRRRFDLVFIDADHSYPGVRRDIENWYPVVKLGGWIGGHDYYNGYPGVEAAVNESFGKEAVEKGAEKTWWVAKPRSPAFEQGTSTTTSTS